MGDPNAIAQILWSTDPTTQRAIWMVLGFALVAAIGVYLPLIVRLVRLHRLERKLRILTGYSTDETPFDPSTEDSGSPRSRRAANHRSVDPEDLRDLFVDSPAAAAYLEFERRWKTSQLSEGIDRAPIRLLDVLDEKPLLPFGPRRSLLPALPGLFLGLGVFAALVGMIPSLAGGTAVVSGQTANAVLGTQLGLALRATAWGFLCAIGATLSGRLIEGGFDARSAALDRILERVFGSVSPGELAEITRKTQQQSLDTLGRELSTFANEFNDRLDRGLQRIEQSTARSASLVSQEQRGALHTVVQELSLSVRQGVEHHLAELRGALQRAIEHQTSVTNGLAETFERMVENAHTQDRVARTLAESAASVEGAARAMRESTVEMQPVLEHLSATSRGLSDTAERISETQKVVARTAEGVRSSLEHAASGVDDQRQFIEVSLTEIRRALTGLGDGLSDSLERSLRSVDDVLGSTIGQLRATLGESNETIERLAGPIRAAEGSTRETHLALDRVKSEVEALGQWMSQAVKPLRSGLSDVEARAEEIVRSMTEFANNTRQMDKTMEALREEIREESRRLQGTGSELGRRLKLASDAVGLLESTTPAATRHGGTSDPTGSTHRERQWSPSASQHGAHESDPAHSPLPDMDDIDSMGITRSPRAYDPAPMIDPSGDGLENPGRDLTQSGYRVGSPRAKGPDPYGRFEGEIESPSNVRHFPTRDRELGDDLKLSGLLGPSPPEPIQKDEAPTDPGLDSPPGRRDRATPPSDELD